MTTKEYQVPTYLGFSLRIISLCISYRRYFSKNGLAIMSLPIRIVQCINV